MSRAPFDPAALREQVTEWRLDFVVAADALKAAVATGQITEHREMAYALIDSMENAAKEALAGLGATTEALTDYRGEVDETIAVLRGQIDQLRRELSLVSKGGPIF